MKFAVTLFVAAVVVAVQAAPAPEPEHVRTIRQVAATLPANDPLSQLLQDSLLIPQAALQAVSRLLTNPGNTIGQSFNYASLRRQQQQQPLQTL